MKDVSVNDGRTVLFVSHNMAAVKQMCTQGLVLRQGEIVFRGTETASVNFYQNSAEANARFEHTGPLEMAPGNDNIRLLKFEVLPLVGDVISLSSGIRFEIVFLNQKPNINLDVTFELVSADEVAVFHHGALLSTNQDSRTATYSVAGTLVPNLLNAGIYRFKIIFGENQRYVLYKQDDVCQFEVLNEVLGSNSEVLPGVIRPVIEYEVKIL